jgi:hypothetical protein
MVRSVKQLIACHEPGAGKERLQAQLDLFGKRLKDYPQRCADQAPFKTAAEAQAVLHTEMEFVLAAFEILN